MPGALDRIPFRSYPQPHPTRLIRPVCHTYHVIPTTLASPSPFHPPPTSPDRALVAAALYARYAPPKAVLYDPCAGWGGCSTPPAILGRRLQHTTCHIRKEVAAHHRASTLSPGRTKAAAPPCATAPQILPCRAGRLLPNMAGRLLGAIAAGAKAYLACEPSTATHAGLLRLAEDFAAPSGMHTQILKQGAEETSLPPASVDMAFTSPPYFNLEVGRLSCGHPNMAGSPVATLIWQALLWPI